MLCTDCGSRRGCACFIEGGGGVTDSGTGSGSDPRILTYLCATAEQCVADAMAPLGFDYNSTTHKLIVPLTVPAGWILTSNGDGTSEWRAP